MKRISRAVEWKIVAALSAAAATIVTRKVLTLAWHAAGGEPEEAEWGSWAQALAWGIAVGAGMGAARVVAQRASAVGFEKITGERPPVEAAA